MPIVQIDHKLVYFAHVPRCAGSSVENYLHGRFGTLGFLDRGQLQTPSDQLWSKTSPQHVHSEALKRLMPASFFAARFAVVRHPALRLRSVFLYQRDIEQALEPETPFSTWLRRVPGLRQQDACVFDNHLRPMRDLVPADSRIFKLEQGLEPLLRWLDRLAGDSSPIELGHINSHADRIKALDSPAPGPVCDPVPEISPRDLAFIRGMDAADFDRFGYDSDLPPF